MKTRPSHVTLLHILSFMLLVNLCKGFLDKSCAGSGKVICATQDSATLSASNTIISNCEYINCGSVVISGGTLQLTNVKFTNCGGSTSVLQLTNGVDASITNITFDSSFAATGPAAIYVLTQVTSRVSIRNTAFVNSTSKDTAGVIRATGPHQLDCQGCKFRGSRGVTVASVIFIDGGNATFEDCESIDSYSEGSGVFSVNAGNLYLNNIRVKDAIASDYGGVVKAIGAGTLNANNLWVSNVTNGQIDKDCFVQASSYSSIYLNNIIVEDVVNTSSGAINLSQNSFIQITNSIFRNINSYGARCFMDLNLGDVHFDNVTVENVSCGYGSVIGRTYFPNNLYFRNSTFRNITGATGGLLLQAKSTLSLDGVIVENVKTNGHGAFVQAVEVSSVSMTNTKFINNSASAGGVVYLTDNSTALIGSGVEFYGNRAYNGNGGCIAAESFSRLTFNSSDIVAKNNTASSRGGFLSLRQITDGLLTLADMSWKLTGVIDDIFVLNPYFAMEVKGLVLNFPNAYFQGQASSITFSGVEYNQLRLLLTDRLPTFTIKALDYFDNPYVIDEHSIVVVQVKEIERNGSQLGGVTIKGLADQEKGLVFSNLTIKNVQPGRYLLRIQPISARSFQPINGSTTYLDVEVEYDACDPQSQRLIASDSKCVPINSVDNWSRVFVVVISSIFLACSVTALTLLICYRDYHILRANSELFLSLIGLGTIVSFVSVILTINASDWSCMASAWLMNIGFTFSFAAIILKTYRISVVFSPRLIRKDLHKYLNNRILFAYFSLANVAVIAFLIVWTILNPSKITENYRDGSFVAVDVCSTSTFDIVAVFIRLLVQLLTCKVAFDIRNVPSDFNESQKIGFAAYNWILFGAALNLIGLYAITNVTASYIVVSFSIIIPQAITMIILIAIKLYFCVFFPGLVKNRQLRKTTFVATKNNSQAVKKQNSASGSM